MTHEPSNREILEALQDFAGQIDGQLDEMRSDIKMIKVNVNNLDTRVTRIENQMVTKDYLDARLADLRITSSAVRL